MQHRLLMFLSNSQSAGEGFQARLLPSHPKPSPASSPPSHPAQDVLAAKRDLNLGPWTWKTGKGRISGLKGKRDLQVPDWTDSGWRPESSSCSQCCLQCSQRCCWTCCWWSFSFFSALLSVAVWVLLQYGKWKENQVQGNHQTLSLCSCFYKWKRVDCLHFFLISFNFTKKMKGVSCWLNFSVRFVQLLCS